MPDNDRIAITAAAFVFALAFCLPLIVRVYWWLNRRGEVGARDAASEGEQTMIASERILARDWNRPEEDAAWSDL